VSTHNLPLNPSACYQALRARDARFDGLFFFGVQSTGIYCRPVCKARTPLARNCHFFTHPAQAEGAGFRPCLRCRPELAPGQPWRWSTQDASQMLAHQALAWMDQRTPQEGPWAVQALATRLGVSDRHLRRILHTHVGVTPSQYRQTQRLLRAKQLLMDTRLPMARVALLSGFSSTRQFNRAFALHYQLNPTQCRASRSSADTTRIRLSYRPPFDLPAMLAFWRQRAVPGLEWCEAPTAGDDTFSRILALETPEGLCHGWLRLQFDATRHEVGLQISDSFWPHLSAVLTRVRWALDLDADPSAMEAVLQADFPRGCGIRVPGAWNGFELAVRAVLGQQVSVAAARTYAQRLVHSLGTPVNTPWAALTHAFPTPDQVLAASPNQLGELGIVKQRQKALHALAQAVSAGLDLNPGPHVAERVQALLALPGIGAWTAQYIAMRALRWPDAFPAGDLVVQQRLGVRAAPNPERAASERALRWQPWRSYAVLRLWQTQET
jgi:AraC family transcriptional regulator of adaptative response / DNA-3-methyladenine glycosylase II